MTRDDARRARRIEAKRKAKVASRDLLIAAMARPGPGAGVGGDGPDPNFPNAVYWRADGEAMWRGKPLFAPLPKPRPGYTFVNANCDCWRRKFSNLFCSKCTPIDWKEVPNG